MGLNVSNNNPEFMICPKCRTKQPFGEKCVRCGVFVEKYKEARRKSGSLPQPVKEVYVGEWSLGKIISAVISVFLIGFVTFQWVAVAYKRMEKEVSQEDKKKRQQYAQSVATPTPISTVSPEEARRRDISYTFSMYDGSHLELTRSVKKQMNDPKSFEHVKTEYADKGDYIYLEMMFRGKNALGVLVLNKVAARATIDGKILEMHLME